MKHLNNAVEGYSCHHDGKTRPISQADVDIIKLTLEILDIRGGNQELIDILRKWKSIDDNHVYSNLMQYFSTLDEDGLGSSETSKKENKETFFISIRGSLFNVYGLLHIETIDDWKDGQIIPKILINPEESVTANALYRNVTLKFDTITDRNNQIERLEKELETHTNIRFVKIR